MIYLREGETLAEGLSRKSEYRRKEWERDRAHQRRVCYQVIEHERKERNKRLANDWQHYKLRRKYKMDFSKFDKQVDLEGLKKDIEDSANNDFKEVPHGTYEVAITKLELGETGPNSKTPGAPMVKCWFKILEGEYKGSLIFMNQVINQGFQIHIVDEFLKSLETDVEISFESYSQYADMLLDVFEAVDGKLEFGLKYSDNKGFNKFEITEVFGVE